MTYTREELDAYMAKAWDEGWQEGYAYCLDGGLGHASQEDANPYGAVTE